MSTNDSIISQVNNLESRANTAGHKESTADETGSGVQGHAKEGEEIFESEEEEEEEEKEDDDDDSSYTYESEIVDYNLDKEWQDIVTQCNSLVFLVLIPVVGRMIGRRFAHYIWHRVADRIF